MTNFINLITERSNDLDGFFYPLIYFIKDQILNYHIFPLWNPMILSGTPLLPDPQSMLFYPPNILFLLLPINLGFIIIFILHAIWSGFGVYQVTKKLKFTKLTTYYLMLVYIFSPKVFGFLDSGHYGLIISYFFLPWILFCLISLSKKFTKKIFMLLIISLLAIFLNHVLTFFIVLASVLALNFYLFTQKFEKKYIYISLAGLISSIGLSAFVLLPQLDWAKNTNRSLLLTNPDVYPKWNGLKDFFTDLFIPWIHGTNYLFNIDAEKWLTIGIIIPILAIVGFFKFKRNSRIIIFLMSTLIVLVTLNNLSPIYQIMIRLPFYQILRVTTRVWLPFYLLIILLAGFGLEQLLKSNKKIAYFMLTLSLLEIFSLSYLRITKPIVNSTSVPEQLYTFLKQDKSLYRVFCITNCIPQKQAAVNNLELIEGYSTLIQTNYNKETWQFTGQFWDYYSLSIPPAGITLFTKIEPDPYALGLYNTKYIISPYSIDNPHLKFLEDLSGYRIYLNQDFLPRAYFWNNKQFSGEAQIIYYSPNQIKINVKNKPAQSLILSQTYNNGWKAYLDNTQEVKIQETPDGLSQVDINQPASFVEFKYQPDSFKLGSILSIATLGILIIWLVF